ncbi:TetR/AcrR family transcriptional regulator [Nocardioides jiangxiensis]|uniref:TetR/AcrR family transcriptional regulator n=1 Tax=Nocardioides jiangxiensis TaxID=3064524 RepID=A0ABT9B1J6_9ACTN|nr:TetR/AcrR family transcriptional regulator [Nocardioides sp. WY-20]MDO7868108.1 TetR/AcrR family transcriptional regulator [Nocardioides sp. WY-20]
MSEEVSRTRTRLSPEDRRRQLLGIGLRMLVEKPIQDLSLDAVAAEAGISRGLLFHYFPTKTDYYDAVLGAASRRVQRNLAPDPDAPPEVALRQFVERFYAQVERRRAFYLALVFGSGPLSFGGEGVDSHRMTIARRIVTATGLPESALAVAHGWTAYVEDRALRWSGTPTADRPPLADEVDHACRALHALVAIEGDPR